MTTTAFAFQSPWWLLALLLLPLAVGGYLAAQGRRRTYALRFSNLATLESVMPAGPGARRHVPPVLLLLSLAALIFALARPEADVVVDQESASIVLVTDTSGSMMCTDVRPSRLVAARDAAGDFLDQVPDGVKVGAVAFSNTALALQRPTRDRDDVKEALATLVPEGGTATGDGLETALRTLDVAAADGKRPPSAIVLISDGKKTAGADPVAVARRAGRLRVPIYTVALGTPGGQIEIPGPLGILETVRVPPDPETMKRIAAVSKGRFFDSQDTRGLENVYRNLASRLDKADETREITWLFAGLGLLLLAAGAALSLRWFGKVA